ncbi:immunoglobulin kappa light chain-like [Larimichthys crocea]|uniref:immunoglobulin kappa light chain-like n=1 Tax=Larimichthys crocea TaxID=215358 RepID=UPI000F5DFD71|nr:immunoglobulin kappa light chain-like [Larimichthys crocea]
MTSPKFLFYLTCLILGKIVTSAQTTNLKNSSSDHRDGGFISANVGERVTLQCFYGGDPTARFYWYKQTLGEKPRLISIFYKYDKNGTFQNEFKNNPRFTLDTGNGKNHLKISDLRISDSATYYCVSSHTFIFKFAEGITVSVKGSGLKIQPLVHQSASETIQPGGSVTLNCTVHTGTCDGEHSVYWFKDSEESHPGLIYTHGGRNDQCERKPNTQTHTCVYNLPMKSLNLSHAGTYYCAVASCGHILFGNGTKLDFEDEVDSLVLVCLSGALAFTTILSVLLAVLLCVTNKRNKCKCTDSRVRFSAPSTTNAEGDQNEENIHYAALKEHKSNRPRRQRNNGNTECVYSSVKH